MIFKTFIFSVIVVMSFIGCKTKHTSVETNLLGEWKGKYDKNSVHLTFHEDSILNIKYIERDTVLSYQYTITDENVLNLRMSDGRIENHKISKLNKEILRLRPLDDSLRASIDIINIITFEKVYKDF